MPGSPDRTSFIPGRVNVSPSDTQGGSRVPELGPLGSGAARLAAIPAGESPANRGVQCCCSHIQRREGRPTRRKPGCKSPRWLGKLSQIRPGGPGQTHEGLRSYVWGSFGEVTAPETLLIPMNNETSEQIADLF